MKRPSLQDRDDLAAILQGSAPTAASTPGSQPASKPPRLQKRPTPAGHQPKGAETFVKATYYLTLADIALLEAERTRRRAATGQRRGLDLSALVREAVRTAFGR
jgi:hypothetical protein